jgi:hypothetical protein
MPATAEQMKWVQDALQVIKLNQQDQIDELQRKGNLKDSIEKAKSEIDATAQRMTSAISNFFKAYHQGLLDFGIAMLDREMEKEDSSLLKEVAFKALTVFVTLALPEVAAAAEIGELTAEGLKEVTVGLIEIAKDRKSEPKQAEGTFREFTKELGDNAVQKEQDMNAAVAKGVPALKNGIEALALKEGKMEGNVQVLLTVLKGWEQLLTGSLKGWTDSNKFEQLFASEFAGKQGQVSDGESVLSSKRDAGTLYFRIYLFIEGSFENKHTYSVRDMSSPKWKLVMIGNKSEAEGAARALLESYKSPWKCDLPRKVLVDVSENSVSDGHKYNVSSGWLVFKKGNKATNPDSFEEVQGSEMETGPGKYGTKLIVDAWAQFQSVAIGNNKLEGDNH